jgi:capsid assembly protease
MTDVNSDEQPKGGALKASLAVLLGGRGWALHRPVLERIYELDGPDWIPVTKQAEMDAASMQARRGGPRNVRGVSVVALHGIIRPWPSLLSLLFGGGGGGLVGFMEDLSTAMGDPDTSAIVLDIDSPGGLVDLVPETATQIRDMRDQGSKPIVAVANTWAASAAYWLASQAHEVICTPSGEVGSVGVYQVHYDESEAWAQIGVKPTLISAGEQKVDGNSYEPLDPEAAKAMQETVDDLYAMFVSDVAKGRGIEPPAADGKAFGGGRSYLAQRALKAGLVDRVATMSDTIRRLSSGRAKVKQYQSPASLMVAGPIPSHSAGTSDDAWDGPANEANLSNDAGEATYRKAYAWVDSDGDPDVKASYRFIHHFVSSDGTVGAASTKACSTGIGVLNGARGGTTIPSGDRKGVYDHLKRHLTDAGQDAPDLAAEVLDAPAAELEQLSELAGAAAA